MQSTGLLGQVSAAQMLGKAKLSGLLVLVLNLMKQRMGDYWQLLPCDNQPCFLNGE